MNKLLFAVAATLGVLSLAACGGSHAVSGPVPTATAQQPSGGGQSTGRRPQSSCTPDSYGYCLAFLSKAIINQNCGGLIVQNTTKRYELYYYTTDEGTYTYTIDNCQGTQTWSPDDPSAVTGDPNLP
ncbi:MAG TPA: hypothetical protein VHS78_15485 [Candidatus Elarobacter sp.]|jgi:hypothetical protein|nr:hypothetical protein [Candidatus Elarobacter sp.]